MFASTRDQLQGQGVVADAEPPGYWGDTGFVVPTLSDVVASQFMTLALCLQRRCRSHQYFRSDLLVDRHCSSRAIIELIVSISRFPFSTLVCHSRCILQAPNGLPRPQRSTTRSRRHIVVSAAASLHLGTRCVLSTFAATGTQQHCTGESRELPSSATKPPPVSVQAHVQTFNTSTIVRATLSLRFNLADVLIARPGTC